MSRLLLCTSCLWLCSCYQTCVQQEGDRVTEQRYLGQAFFDNAGVAVKVTPGVVRVDSNGVETTTFRASVPNPKIDIYMNDDADGQFTLLLTNIHPKAQLNVVAVEQIVQNAAFADFGLVENTDSCPATITQPDPDCSTDKTGECAPPTFNHLATNPAHAQLTVDLLPCRRYTFRVELPEEDESAPTTFAVIGRTRSVESLKTILDKLVADAPDFVVFLGDANQDNEEEHLIALQRVMDRAQTSVVIIPGQDEINENPALFAQTYGAFDFRWTFKGAQFVTFYTSTGQMGGRGLRLLQSYLKAMSNEDQLIQKRESGEALDIKRLPAYAFTYLPPLDPSGLSDDGLMSRHEAARVLSLLAQFGIHTLFAGGRHEPASTGDTPTVRVTSATSTVAQAGDEYLWVTLDDTLFTGAQAVGNQFMRIDTMAIP